MDIEELPSDRDLMQSGRHGYLICGVCDGTFWELKLHPGGVSTRRCKVCKSEWRAERPLSDFGIFVA